MSRESTLEKYIKDFVEYKCGERVYLRLSDSIEIHSLAENGSISLASLWANVLQHKANFPPSKYPYRTKKVEGDEQLVLEACGVRFSVSMASGRLVMRGQFVYDWFTNKFKSLLDNFDIDFARSWVFKRTSTATAECLDVRGDDVEEPYRKSGIN